MNLIGYIWEVAINIMEALLFAYLLVQTLHLKPTKKMWFILGLVFRIIGITFLNLSTKNSTLSLLLLLFYDISLSFLLFDNNTSEKLLRGSSYVFVALIADKATFWIANIFTGFKLKELVITGNVRFIMSLIYILICLILVVVLVHKKRKNYYYYFPIRIQIIFVFLLCIGIIASDQLLSLIIVSDFKGMKDFFVPRMEVISFIFLTVLISFSISIEYAGIVLHQNETLRQKNLIYEVEKKHYETIDTTISVLKMWKHDYAINLQVIYNLAKENKLPELLNYVEQLKSDLHKSAELISTGNHILDAILSVEALEMEKEGIDFNYEIYLTPTLPFEETDFASLIGNLLNNAIRSCKDIDHHKKYINFIIKPHQDMLYINIKNSSSGYYKYDDSGDLKSTKENGHGLGLKRTQEIVKQKGGFFNIYAEKENFKIVIMVPISERTEERIEN